MNLTATSKTLNSHIPFGQVGNQISSSGVFPKQFIEQASDTEILCAVSFSEFNVDFTFEVIEINGDEFSEEIIFKLKYADTFFVHLTLKGYWELVEELGFRITDVSWFFEGKEDTHTAVFLLQTFKAILCLSDKVKVEFLNTDFFFGVSVPLLLNNISEILQIRQMAYRLMVIEKVFNLSLPCPNEFITGEENENIAFCYHSVIDRKFEWLSPPAAVPWIASQEYLSILPQTNIPFPIQYGPEPTEKKLFGFLINLGLQIAKIDEYILDNFEETKREISKLDGEQVIVQGRSKNGSMKIESVTTPHLPENAFGNEIQKLIDLEDKFDSIYFDKYLNSFPNAFENLTEEQIQAVTESPTLEEEAFNF